MRSKFVRAFSFFFPIFSAFHFRVSIFRVLEKKEERALETCPLIFLLPSHCYKRERRAFLSSLSSAILDDDDDHDDQEEDVVFFYSQTFFPLLLLLRFCAWRERTHTSTGVIIIIRRFPNWKKTSSSS